MSKERMQLHQKIEDANSEIGKIKSELNILSQNLETQHNLYQSNLEDYGSITTYRKELFGEDGNSGLKVKIDNIHSKINAFSEFYDGQL